MIKSKIAKFISIIFIIVLILGIGGFFFLPKLYDIFKAPVVAEFNAHHLAYRCAFYACYIICLMVVYNLMKLFKYIYSDTPFRKEIEIILKQCAVMFMVLAIIVAIKIFFIPTLLSLAVAFVCFVASLSFYCLAEVIKAAIAYKNEIDYTV